MEMIEKEELNPKLIVTYKVLLGLISTCLSSLISYLPSPSLTTFLSHWPFFYSVNSLFSLQGLLHLQFPTCSALISDSYLTFSVSFRSQFRQAFPEPHLTQTCAISCFPNFFFCDILHLKFSCLFLSVPFPSKKTLILQKRTYTFLFISVLLVSKHSWHTVGF